MTLCMPMSALARSRHVRAGRLRRHRIVHSRSLAICAERECRDIALQLTGIAHIDRNDVKLE